MLFRVSRVLLSITLLLVSIAAAQQAAAPSSKSTAGSLPSEETVNAFMKATFGYDPSLTWKVADIRPSQAEGVAHAKFIAFGVAAKVVVVVEDQNPRLRPGLLTEKVGSRKSADASAYHNQVVSLAGVRRRSGGVPESPIAQAVCNFKRTDMAAAQAG